MASAGGVGRSAPPPASAPAPALPGAGLSQQATGPCHPSGGAAHAHRPAHPLTGPHRPRPLHLPFHPGGSELDPAEDDLDPHGARLMSARVLHQLCRSRGHYLTPACNTTLYLQDLRFRRIQNLEEFTSCRVLHLANNCLSRIEGLEKMTGLQALYLHTNDLRSLEGLSPLTSLATLHLSNNPALGSLAGLPPSLSSLRTLHAANTGLTSAASLSGLSLDRCPSLEVLDLSSNAGLGGREVLDVLCGLRGLRVLYVMNTRLQQIPNLRRILVSALPRLSYLDNAPVDECDRRGCEAWLLGGVAAEKAARLAYRAERRLAQKRCTATFAVERARRRALREMERAGNDAAALELILEDTEDIVRRRLAPSAAAIIGAGAAAAAELFPFTSCAAAAATLSYDQVDLLPLARYTASVAKAALRHEAEAEAEAGEEVEAEVEADVEVEMGAEVEVEVEAEVEADVEVEMGAEAEVEMEMGAEVKAKIEAADIEAAEAEAQAAEGREEAQVDAAEAAGTESADALIPVTAEAGPVAAGAEAAGAGADAAGAAGAAAPAGAAATELPAAVDGAVAGHSYSCEAGAAAETKGGEPSTAAAVAASGPEPHTAAAAAVAAAAGPCTTASVRECSAADVPTPSASTEAAAGGDAAAAVDLHGGGAAGPEARTSASLRDADQPREQHHPGTAEVAAAEEGDQEWALSSTSQQAAGMQPQLPPPPLASQPAPSEASSATAAAAPPPQPGAPEAAVAAATAPPPCQRPMVPWHVTGLSECVVCSEAFAEEQLVALLPCHHFFHDRCIRRWLLGFSNSCPMCRALVRPGPGAGAPPQHPTTEAAAAAAAVAAAAAAAVMAAARAAAAEAPPSPAPAPAPVPAAPAADAGAKPPAPLGASASGSPKAVTAAAAVAGAVAGAAAGRSPTGGCGGDDAGDDGRSALAGSSNSSSGGGGSSAGRSGVGCAGCDVDRGGTVVHGEGSGGGGGAAAAAAAAAATTRPGRLVCSEGFDDDDGGRDGDGEDSGEADDETSGKGRGWRGGVALTGSGGASMTAVTRGSVGGRQGVGDAAAGPGANSHTGRFQASSAEATPPSPRLGNAATAVTATDGSGRCSPAGGLTRSRDTGGGEPSDRHPASASAAGLVIIAGRQTAAEVRETADAAGGSGMSGGGSSWGFMSRYSYRAPLPVPRGNVDEYEEGCWELPGETRVSEVPYL